MELYASLLCTREERGGANDGGGAEVQIQLLPNLQYHFLGILEGEVLVNKLDDGGKIIDIR